jgi:Zn-dependent protease with chaperone function
LNPAAFHGRLFGAGLGGAGAAAHAWWEGSRLAVQAGDAIHHADGASLQVEAAGFNLRQLKLSWNGAEGSYDFFVEAEEDFARLLSGAPESMKDAFAGAQGRRRSMGRRFSAAVAVYGAVISLPLLLLLAFLLNIGHLVDWIAEKIPVHYEDRIGDVVLAQTRAQMKLIDSGPAHEAVQAIGERLTAGSAYRYRWFIADRKDINAFAAPGGVIVVHAGLIAQTAQAEELAGVLAHEVAHVEHRHSLKNLMKTAGLSVLLSLVLGDWSGTALGNAAGKLTELKFSRDAETDADREGLRRLVDAGIAPHPMADFFSKLSSKESGMMPSMLATHPASAEREERLRSMIAALPTKQYAPLPFNWAEIKTSLNLPTARRQSLLAD